MAELPRRLRLPPLDTPLLEWWARDYDHVFIAYSPFFRVPGHTPETAAYGKIYIDRADADGILDIVANPPMRPNEAPPDFEQTIKNIGTPLRWRALHEEIGIGDFKAFARTVWLWTVEADRQDRDERIVAALEKLVHETGLYQPEEDNMPVILEPLIARYLAAAGIERVRVSDEFAEETQIRTPHDFAPGTAPVTLTRAPVSVISTDTPDLAFLWPWDEVAGFICLSDSQRRACPPETIFEGEYAGPATYADWLNPHDFFPRKGHRRQQ